MSTEVDRLLQVEKAMPLHSEWALARFTKVNPHYNGAAWADCLEVLYDSDSNLDVTEPIWEALEGLVTPEQGRYISLVALTLLYANPDDKAPTPAEVHAWVKAIEASTNESNSSTERE